MDRKRLSIGLLISEYCDIFAREVCMGAMYAAEEMDANLYILAGGYFDAPYMERNKSKYEYQNNYLFNFVTEKNIDVLVVLLGTIASNVDGNIQKQFLEKYKGIPLITIANKVDGYANISFNNKAGFAKEVEYLIHNLGRKQIGIVCGPATNEDSIERLAAYKEVLEKNHLEIDEGKIVYGNFTEYVDEIVEDLLNRNPDLDAIVFSNDHMAVGGYRVLEKRGLKIGQDISVVGFDDMPAASMMDPSLTTTRADSSELGYRAIMEACKLKPGEDKDIRIDTALVVRESCGGRAKDIFAHLNSKFNFNPAKDDADVLVKQISQMLFDGYTEETTITIIEKELKQFTGWMLENVYQKSIDDTLYHEISAHFLKLNSEIFARMDNVSMVYEIGEYLMLLFIKAAKSEQDKSRLYAALAECYKNILILNERHKNQSARERDIVNHVSMAITRDIVSDDNAENYDTLLSRMYQLEFPESYVLLFPKVVKCRKNGKWKMPKNMLLKAYQKGKKSYVPDEEKQSVSIQNLFQNPFLDDGKRKTYAVSFLFSKDEQYGIFVVETNRENLIAIEPVTFQISSAIQTNRLIRSKEAITAQLEESLQQLKETNAFLDEVSKSDELTQIYNRRGFLVTVRKLMRDPDNLNRFAVIIYADMNNLKLINDKFGHEEGDYSLKSIAQIMRKALGEETILGRLGGDEFAAFLFVEDKNYEQVLRGRIAEETVQLNDSNDKLYYISMSVGMSSFVNEEGFALNEAMVRADVDLYLQKKHKRNNILK
jgi:diguanylate cyclase (GGDEF)-like protein